MLTENELRTDSIPKIKVTPNEKRVIENRMAELGFKKYGKYVRYCIKKEMEGK
ncbi:hypothetical protein [Clostridium brassicae]|uniref:Uncharacterized protein n=1 Tax=Clostridium brassicae TaxID=2999072 RepID=A0ABT4D6D5_9CLOT|nr:hypothetical protein [Clostridium brassicae]MCY6957853.1 hypothetical protein [Clostridium brassicae]